jgi:hypothetical protein
VLGVVVVVVGVVAGVVLVGVAVVVVGVVAVGELDEVVELVEVVELELDEQVVDAEAVQAVGGGGVHVVEADGEEVDSVAASSRVAAGMWETRPCPCAAPLVKGAADA